MSHVLHQIVLPRPDDEEVRSLYLRDGGGVRVLDRRRVAVDADATVSFGTYFNGFPAGYWQRWTAVEMIDLAIAVEGSATIRVWRSDARGAASVIAERVVTDGGARVGVDLAGFDAGGWLWFDMVAAGGAATLAEAAWTTGSESLRSPRTAIGITTFNKPDYAAATLGEIARASDVRPFLSRVFVVDQGDRPVSEEPGFDAVAESLGGTLSIIRQPNLGGSGGYARAMAETLATEDAGFVMLIDDDVQVEPESIRRAIVFGAFCRTPTIVGGHMIDLLDRTKLYAWAEIVDEHPFMWRPLHDEAMPIDLAARDLRDTPLLHRRMDADYNGWWMCLIPREALEGVGLPLPAFIKWDDAEYSLRAADHGIRTVSLPGVALWHISWVGKDDLIDWQAYFHARNRIVTALLHSDAPRGGSLLVHSRRVDIKHLLSMQYYPVALRHRALRAVLSGPDHLHGDLGEALSAARALAAGFPETRPAGSSAARSRPDWPTDAADMPGGMRLRAFMATTLVRLWLHRTRSSALEEPEIAVHARQAKWWRLTRADSALVTMAGSEVQHVYVRDRGAHRRLSVDSIRLHRELRRRWDELARAYRAADITSSARWAATFQAAGSPAPEPVSGGGTPGSEERLS